MKLNILVQPLILSYAAAMSLPEPAPVPELEARYIGELCTVPVGVGLSLPPSANDPPPLFPILSSCLSLHFPPRIPNLKLELRLARGVVEELLVKGRHH
jgi:hypothetical protein